MTKTTLKHQNKSLRILFITAIVIIAAVVIAIICNKTSSYENISSEKKLDFNLENGLSITSMGSYSGPYMEDASDEEVTDVMAIFVTNNSENALQYAEVILSNEAGEEALFQLSTLNPGQTVMVLEAERKSYDKNAGFTKADSQYVVFFEEPLNTYEDILEVQPLDGGFNITNISGEDISGEIMVYFKDYEGDLLCGGITYRGRIEGGLEAGEIRQVMSSNFSETGTKVMFITVKEK